MGIVLFALGLFALLGLSKTHGGAHHKAATKAPGMTGMPASLAAQYQQAKLTVRADPRNTLKVSELLRSQGYVAEADELLALVNMQAVTESPKTTPAEKTVAAAITATAAVLASPNAAVIPKPTQTPITTPALAAARSASPLVQAAQRVGDHLNALVKARGTVARAKGKEDQGLVRNFQTQTKLKVDGMYGPKTALMLGRYWGDVPLVFYWPKGTVPSTEVPKYRTNLHTLALEAIQIGDERRAQLLEFSAAREQGQGYGSTTSVPVSPRDPAPVQKAAETMSQQVALVLYAK